MGGRRARRSCIFRAPASSSREIVAAHRRQRVLVVCHGGVIEFAFDHIFNIGPWRRCEVWTHNTGVTHFEYVEHLGAKSGACAAMIASTTLRPTCADRSRPCTAASGQFLSTMEPAQ